MLSVWMSPADGARLFHAALTAENVGHTVVHGSSANTRLWWDLTSARALGYEPQDDSEPYAGKLVAEQGELDPGNPAHARLGGHFVTDPRSGRTDRKATTREPPKRRTGTERARPLPHAGIRAARSHPAPRRTPGPRRAPGTANGHTRAVSGPQQAWSVPRDRCRTSPKGHPGPNGQPHGDEAVRQVFGMSTRTRTTEERRHEIVRVARATGSVDVTALAAELGVAKETVRRDLRALEDHGLVRRTHGGAYPVESAGFETTLAFRATSHVPEKRRIASAAVELLGDAETVFVDEGFTPSSSPRPCPGTGR